MGPSTSKGRARHRYGPGLIVWSRPETSSLRGNVIVARLRFRQEGSVFKWQLMKSYYHAAARWGRGGENVELNVLPAAVGPNDSQRAVHSVIALQRDFARITTESRGFSFLPEVIPATTTTPPPLPSSLTALWCRSVINTQRLDLEMMNKSTESGVTSSIVLP